MEPRPMTEPTVSNISITIVSGSSNQGTFSVDVSGGTITDVKVNTMNAETGEPDPKNGEIPKTLTNSSGDTWTGVITYNGQLATRATAYTGKLKIAYTNPANADLESSYEPNYTSGVRA